MSILCIAYTHAKCVFMCACARVHSRVCVCVVCSVHCVCACVCMCLPQTMDVLCFADAYQLLFVVNCVGSIVLVLSTLVTHNIP